MIGIRVWIFISIIAVVAASCTGLYIYYKDTQKRIEFLNQQVVAFTVAVEEQKQTITVLERSLELQQSIRADISSEMEATRRDVEKLQSTLMEHNFKIIAEKKPTLFERKINNATRDMLRCFEVASGDNKKPDEKNNQCNFLFNAP